jgi:signal transduction histidine kinase
MADPTQLHQIAMNLITNAYHAVEQSGGNISVTLSQSKIENVDFSAGALAAGEYAVLSVSDTGSGIDPEAMEKIFEPYFTTKSQDKGTGLGLAVVYGIVKEYNGDIKVHSELRKGTRFDVYLPLIKRFDAIGIKAVLMKPIIRNELARTVRRVLDEMR